MPWGRHWGGYPYPIMLCNITQNSMGQTPRGVPSQVQLGGTLPGFALQHYPEFHGADTWGGTQPCPDGGGPCEIRTGGVPAGGTQMGYPQAGTPPVQVRMGVGGYPPGQDGGYPARGYPDRVPPSSIPPRPGQDGGVPS